MGRNLSRSFRRCGDDLHRFGPPLARIFHDQNRVFAAERDQKDQVDLRLEIFGGANSGQRTGRSEQRERHVEDN